MANYDFLNLVNAVNQRLNEVPLTEANFLSAGGWYSQAKESVNAAIRMIAQEQFEWPFNHVRESMTLTKGVSIYPYPAGAQSINFESFRLNKDVALNSSYMKIENIDYEDAIGYDFDINTPEPEGRGRPRAVIRMPGLEFGLFPTPNENYKITFDWFRLPLELTDYQEVPFVPEQWKHVIVNGAMYFAYMFRGDPESSMVMKQLFDSDIKAMRKLYQNRFEYVRSGVYQVGGNPFNATFAGKLGGF